MFALFKRTSFFLTFILLMGCPSSDDNCNDYSRTARVENLITLIPVQEIYSQGDEITLKVTIPAINNYFGDEINLFFETNDQSALLVTNSLIFSGNSLNFIEGSMGEYDNWLNMPFNSETENYEVELKITLNRVGQYSFLTSDFIEFIGNDCDRFRLDTSYDWEYTNGRVEFSVIE